MKLTSMEIKDLLTYNKIKRDRFSSNSPVTFSMSQEEYNKVKRLADKYGMNKSQFLRFVLRSINEADLDMKYGE